MSRIVKLANLMSRWGPEQERSLTASETPQAEKTSSERQRLPRHRFHKEPWLLIRHDQKAKDAQTAWRIAARYAKNPITLRKARKNYWSCQAAPDRQLPRTGALQKLTSRPPSLVSSSSSTKIELTWIRSRKRSPRLARKLGNRNNRRKRPRSPRKRRKR